MSLVIGVTLVLAVMTVLPLIRWSHGIIRVCEFPRVQIAAIAALLIPVTWLLAPGQGWLAILIGTQMLIVFAQAWSCLLYTPLHSVQSLRHEAAKNGGRGIRILSANIKLSNRRFATVVDLIRETDPDIAIVIEADDAWARALEPLRSELPHVVSWPCDNSYGMVLMSRLPLIDPELRFLVFNTVPSIRTAVKLRNGDLMRLYAVHPEPPVPYEDTIGRDGELLKVAAEARDDPLPAIVAGDLNDVAWSRTTRRFQRLSGLLDPRVGRGFFNTFDARIPFLRWPLDHLFHDSRFRLVRIERLANVGSDHFPMLFDLVLHDQPAGDRAAEADKQDFREARGIAAASNQVGRSPIGSQWERPQG